MKLLANSDNVLVDFSKVMSRRIPKFLMGIRNISNATNSRTIVASVIPTCATNHKITLVSVNNSIPIFLGCMNSIVLDFTARLKVGGTDICNYHLYQLPVISPSQVSKNVKTYICQLVEKLLPTSNKIAHSLSLDLNIWNDGERIKLRAELDALYARLYGLNREELMYILDPESVMGKDYPSQTFPGLKNKEIRKYGEYRTMRLVLEAWDRQERQPELWQ